MFLQKTSFDDESIEKYCMGAGVVFCATHPVTNELQLLLGRERWSAAWKGSCRWSGLEGSRKAEESMEDVAVRECTEESLGVCSTADAVRERIRQRDYWFRLVLKIQNPRKVAERYHCTYVMHVPWNADLPAIFSKTRGQLEHAERLSLELNHTKPDAIARVPHVGRVLKMEDHTRVERRIDDEPGVIQPPWEVDPNDGRYVTLRVDDEKTERDLQRWNEVRGKLQRAVIDHPAARVTRHDNIVERVSISHDHMEKDQLRWWSISDLERVVAQRGTDDNERFRPYFMPVLQTIVEEHRAWRARRVPRPPGL